MCWKARVLFTKWVQRHIQRTDTMLELAVKGCTLILCSICLTPLRGHKGSGAKTRDKSRLQSKLLNIAKIPVVAGRNHDGCPHQRMDHLQAASVDIPPQDDQT